MKKIVIIAILLLGGSTGFAQLPSYYYNDPYYRMNPNVVPIMNTNIPWNNTIGGTGFMPGGCMPRYSSYPMYQNFPVFNSVGPRIVGGYHPGTWVNQFQPCVQVNPIVTLVGIIAASGLLSNGSLNQSPQLTTPAVSNQGSSTVTQNVNIFGNGNY